MKNEDSICESIGGCTKMCINTATRRSAQKRSRENAAWCKNDRFCVGQIYKIRAGHKEIDARVKSMSRYYVTFATPKGDISGELMQVTNPRCQSCNIDGYDIVYSYECRARDVP